MVFLLLLMLQLEIHGQSANKYYSKGKKKDFGLSCLDGKKKKIKIK